MKFLCIACDQAMRLSGTGGPDAGSLTVTFTCPACGHRVAMLTNPWETQMVRTLGVKVGGAPAEAPAPFAAVRAGLAHQRDTGLAAEAPAPVSGSLATAAAGTAVPDGPGCPFAAMIGGTGTSGGRCGRLDRRRGGAPQSASRPSSAQWPDRPSSDSPRSGATRR